MRGRDCTDQIDGECMNLAEELQCVELRDGNSEELREGDCAAWKCGEELPN
jgi:hypothetical protein